MPLRRRVLPSRATSRPLPSRLANRTSLSDVPILALHRIRPAPPSPDDWPTDAKPRQPRPRTSPGDYPPPCHRRPATYPSRTTGHPVHATLHHRPLRKTSPASPCHDHSARTWRLATCAPSQRLPSPEDLPARYHPRPTQPERLTTTYYATPERATSHPRAYAFPRRATTPAIPPTSQSRATIQAEHEPVLAGRQTDPCPTELRDYPRHLEPESATHQMTTHSGPLPRRPIRPERRTGPPHT